MINEDKVVVFACVRVQQPRQRGQRGGNPTAATVIYGADLYVIVQLEISSTDNQIAILIYI